MAPGPNNKAFKALLAPLLPYSIYMAFYGPYKALLTTHPGHIPINETNEKLPYAPCPFKQAVRQGGLMD